MPPRRVGRAAEQHGSWLAGLGAEEVTSLEREIRSSGCAESDRVAGLLGLRSPDGAAADGAIGGGGSKARTRKGAGTPSARDLRDLSALLPAPGTTRKAGLWSKDAAALAMLGEDPAQALRPDLSTPPGLVNLGSTCYVNTVLQCLYSIRPLREAIEGLVVEEEGGAGEGESGVEGGADEPKDGAERQSGAEPERETESEGRVEPKPEPQSGAKPEPEGRSLPSADPVLRELRAVFLQLSASPQRAVDPTPLVEALELDSDVQQDGQEFLKLFLQLLDSRLRDVVPPGAVGGAGSPTLVESLFAGRAGYETVCASCGQASAASARTEALWDVEVRVRGGEALARATAKGRTAAGPGGGAPAPAARDVEGGDRDGGARGRAPAVPPPTGLEASVLASLAPERLEGENAYLCDRCGRRGEATRTRVLRRLPPLLSLSLSRFVFDYRKMDRAKVSDPLSFPLILDATEWVRSPTDGGEGGPSGGPPDPHAAEPRLLYDLQAIMLHKGSSARHGHYVAHVLRETGEGHARAGGGAARGGPPGDRPRPADPPSSRWWRFDDGAVSEMEGGPASSPSDHGVSRQGVGGKTTGRKRAGDEIETIDCSQEDGGDGDAGSPTESGRKGSQSPPPGPSPARALRASPPRPADPAPGPAAAADARPPTIRSSSAYFLLYRQRGAELPEGAADPRGEELAREARARLRASWAGRVEAYGAARAGLLGRRHERRRRVESLVRRAQSALTGEPAVDPAAGVAGGSEVLDLTRDDAPGGAAGPTPFPAAPSPPRASASPDVPSSPGTSASPARSASLSVASARPPLPPGSLRFVPTSWLLAWANAGTDAEVPPLSFAPLLSSSGAPDPDKVVALARALPADAAAILAAEHGDGADPPGLANLSTDEVLASLKALTSEAAEERARAEAVELASACLDARDEGASGGSEDGGEAGAAPPSGAGGEGGGRDEGGPVEGREPGAAPRGSYLVSRPWLAAWVRRKGQRECSASATSPTAAIACPHGRLAPDSDWRTGRVDVPAELWEHLAAESRAVAQEVAERKLREGEPEGDGERPEVVDLPKLEGGAPKRARREARGGEDHAGGAPSAPPPAAFSAFASSSEACAECAASLASATTEAEALVARTEAEQARLRPLLAPPSLVALETGQVYYLVPSAFTHAWRAYVAAGLRRVKRKGGGAGDGAPPSPPDLSACLRAVLVPGGGDDVVGDGMRTGDDEARGAPLQGGAEEGGPRDGGLAAEAARGDAPFLLSVLPPRAVLRRGKWFAEPSSDPADPWRPRNALEVVSPDVWSSLRDLYLPSAREELRRGILARFEKPPAATAATEERALSQDGRGPVAGAASVDGPSDVETIDVTLDEDGGSGDAVAPIVRPAVVDRARLLAAAEARAAPALLASDPAPAPALAPAPAPAPAPTPASAPSSAPSPGAALASMPAPQARRKPPAFLATDPEVCLAAVEAGARAARAAALVYEGEPVSVRLVCEEEALAGGAVPGPLAIDLVGGEPAAAPPRATRGGSRRPRAARLIVSSSDTLGALRLRIAEALRLRLEDARVFLAGRELAGDDSATLAEEGIFAGSTLLAADAGANRAEEVVPPCPERDAGFAGTALSRGG